MVLDDNNNNSEANLNNSDEENEANSDADNVLAEQPNGPVKRSLKLSDEKYRLLRQQKSQKLKQLKFDLCKEEAKLILLKRLYYSQRMPAVNANAMGGAAAQAGGQRPGGVPVPGGNMKNAMAPQSKQQQMQQHALQQQAQQLGQQRGGGNQFLQNNNNMQQRSLINQRVGLSLFFSVVVGTVFILDIDVREILCFLKADLGHGFCGHWLFLTFLTRFTKRD